MLPAAATAAGSARPQLGWVPSTLCCDKRVTVAQAASHPFTACPLLGHALTTTTISSSSIHGTSFFNSSSSSSSSCSSGRRRSVIAADKRAKTNPFVDIQRDLLPDGKPNTPWRRLKLRIQTTTSLQGLARVYSSSRHKSAVWRPIHAAGILMRLAALQYYRLLLPPHRASEQTSAAAHQLLQLLTPDLTDPAVCRVLDSARLAQLLVVLSALNPQPGPEVLDPLVRELMRDGGKKLPASKPDLLAELAAALARLEWRELEVWLAVAAAAKGSLRAAALQQQQQQQWGDEEQWQHQQQQWGDEEQWQQQQQWDAQQSWLRLPLQQQDWRQQQQQQQQEALPNPAAAGGVWQPSIEDYDDAELDGEEDEELQGDFWGESDQEVYQEDEEELYEEDPSYWSLEASRSDPIDTQQQQQQQHQQQWIQQEHEASTQPNSSSSSSSSGQVWLSFCYPKIAAALAAVGCEDEELMQLLGDAAVRVLPLLSASELADLASAYAQLGLPHQQLLPALAAQLKESAGSSSSGVQGLSAAESEVTAVVRAAHALGQLGFADVQLVQAVQSAVLSSRSTYSTAQPAGGSDTAQLSPAAPVGTQQLVQLLQLLVLSGCTGSSSSSNNNGSGEAQKSKTLPLVRWVCNAIASSGLEALQPQQMQAAAAALVQLQDHREAAAAAAVVGAAAVARAEECGPEVLAEVLWGCVTLGCANGVLAETAVAAVERAAENLQRQQRQQQQQQQKKKGRQRRAAKPAAVAAEGFSGGVGLQQAAVLGSKHQAQLVLSLQQLGRPDMAQRALNCFAQVHT
uniref:Uncharacterized protein n=1 Tax=Tetradesmus obliquus TaxID=3088 RepID=A0A383VSK9_TETOB|eukprot:jgi/Sobl393_1/16427/SZX67809.1